MARRPCGYGLRDGQPCSSPASWRITVHGVPADPGVWAPAAVTVYLCTPHSTSTPTPTKLEPEE